MVRAASWMFRRYSDALGVDIFEGLSVGDGGDIDFSGRKAGEALPPPGVSWLTEFRLAR